MIPCLLVHLWGEIKGIFEQPQGFNGHKMLLDIKTQKQLADPVSESRSCMLSDVFMVCANETQQAIQVYEAKF